MQQTHKYRARLTTLLALSAVSSVVSPIFGQPNDQDASALKGPAVIDRNVPGAGGDFGMDRAPGRRLERVPPDVFRRAIAVLSADDAPADIRATPEVRAMIRTLVDGFEQEVRAFRRENAKELEALRLAAGEPARRGADRARQSDDAMKELSPAEQKARDDARLKLRELTARGPKIEDVYTKVWTELTEPQRAAVQAKLDEWRDKEAKRREDEYVRRRTKERPVDVSARQPKSDDSMASTTMTSKTSSDDDARMKSRRDRLLRFFNRLSPEEQEQLLKRLEERSRPRRRAGGGEEPSKKAPADPERVNIPNPEGDQ